MEWIPFNLISCNCVPSLYHNRKRAYLCQAITYINGKQTYTKRRTLYTSVSIHFLQNLRPSNSVHESHLHLSLFLMVAGEMSNASVSTYVNNVRHDARSVHQAEGGGKHVESIADHQTIPILNSS